jgi:hypothetical protein
MRRDSSHRTDKAQNNPNPKRMQEKNLGKLDSFLEPVFSYWMTVKVLKTSYPSRFQESFSGRLPSLNVVFIDHLLLKIFV